MFLIFFLIFTVLTDIKLKFHVSLKSCLFLNTRLFSRAFNQMLGFKPLKTRFLLTTLFIKLKIKEDTEILSQFLCLTNRTWFLHNISLILFLSWFPIVFIESLNFLVIKVCVDWSPEGVQPYLPLRLVNNWGGGANWPPSISYCDTNL